MQSTTKTNINFLQKSRLNYILKDILIQITEARKNKCKIRLKKYKIQQKIM